MYTYFTRTHLYCANTKYIYLYKYYTDTPNLQNVTVRASSDSRFRCFVRHFAWSFTGTQCLRFSQAEFIDADLDTTLWEK